MNKKHLYIAAAILVIGVAGWFAYKYTFGKKTSRHSISAQAFSANSCWIYHEYVYRVDFTDDSMGPFLFIRNEDGSFSPSAEESAGNSITGNGFLIDEEGGCVTTEKITTPWTLNEEEQKSLREVVDAWLEMKTDMYSRDYTITGQTVALFVVLNDPEQYIEYTALAPLPEQVGYGLLYPVEKTSFAGVNTTVSYQDKIEESSHMVLQVLKTTFDENAAERSSVKTSADSITAEKNAEGFLENIQVLKGDEFFNEGSIVFDGAGKCLGNLHYENNKWRLMSFRSIAENHRIYEDYTSKQSWEYDINRQGWIKLN